MQNLHLQSDAALEIPGYKLFSAGQITAGTFFGSILTGGYMLAQNYTKLNDVKKANSRLLRSVVYYLLYILSAVVLRELPSGPWLWVGIGFIFIYKFEFKREQKDKYAQHLAHNGERCSNWLVAAICALNLVAYFSIAIIAVFVLELAGF